MMSGPSVIVVGGGILGASIAYALAARSAHVSVLDAAAPGAGASATSFALATAQHKEPGPYFALNAAGLAEYHYLRAEGVGRNWFHPVGNIGIATDPDSSAALAHHAERLRERGYQAELITSDRAAELEPMIDPSRITNAAYYPDEGWVDTEHMVADLLGRVVAIGGEIRPHCAATGFDRVGTQTRVTLTTGEELLADLVVCAVGTATQRLLAPSGIRVPVIEAGDCRLRGQDDERYVALGVLADTAPLPVPLRRAIQTQGLGLRPTSSGRVVLRGDGTGSLVPRSDPSIFSYGPMLLDRARRTFPALHEVPLERVRVGVRALPEDGPTVAGLAQAVAGLYIVVTHSGVTLGPYLGRLIASELLDQQENPALAEFRPGRFQPSGPENHDARHPSAQRTL